MKFTSRVFQRTAALSLASLALIHDSICESVLQRGNAVPCNILAFQTNSWVRAHSSRQVPAFAASPLTRNTITSLRRICSRERPYSISSVSILRCSDNVSGERSRRFSSDKDETSRSKDRRSPLHPAEGERGSTRSQGSDVRRKVEDNSGDSRQASLGGTQRTRGSDDLPAWAQGIKELENHRPARGSNDNQGASRAAHASPPASREFTVKRRDPTRDFDDRSDPYHRRSRTESDFEHRDRSSSSYNRKGYDDRPRFSANSQRPPNIRFAPERNPPRYEDDDVYSPKQTLPPLPGLQPAATILTPPAGWPVFAGIPIPPRYNEWLLSAAGVTAPTAIQLAAAADIFRGASCLLHSPTGTGKTLAFLLPIAARIAAAAAVTGKPPPPLSVLVLVPTRELALQVAEVAVGLLGTAGVALAVGGTERHEDQLALLCGLLSRPAGGGGAAAPSPAVLIATPDRLLAILALPGPSSSPSSFSPPMHTQSPAEKLPLSSSPSSSSSPFYASSSSRAPPAYTTAKSSSATAAAADAAAAGAERLLCNVETVVVDEVDRMLDSLGRYATARAQVKRARHPKPALLLLEALFAAVRRRCAATAATNTATNTAATTSAAAAAAATTAGPTYKAKGLQFVGCSATVGRPIRRELANLEPALGMRMLPVVRPPGWGDIESELPAAQRTGAEIKGVGDGGDAALAVDGGSGPGSDLASRSPHVNAVAGGSANAMRLRVPEGLRHYFVTVKDEAAKYGALQSLLLYACPTEPALVFVPPSAPVGGLVAKMRFSGIPRAVALHEAMGFHVFDARNASAADAAPTAVTEPPSSSSLDEAAEVSAVGELRSSKEENGGAVVGGDEVAKLEARQAENMADLLNFRQRLKNALSSQEGAPLLVVNEATCRGLDLPLNVVFIWQAPAEAAEYLHMAGRTARAGRSGTVVTLLTKTEKNRLSTLESHMGIKIRYLEDYSLLAGPAGDLASEDEGDESRSVDDAETDEEVEEGEIPLDTDPVRSKS